MSEAKKKKKRGTSAIAVAKSEADQHGRGNYLNEFSGAFLDGWTGRPRQKTARSHPVYREGYDAGRDYGLTHPPPKKNPARMTELDAAAMYRRTHWGLRGDETPRMLRVAEPRKSGTLVQLGDLVSVVYRTKKLGDSGPTEYEHEFERSLPVLCHDGNGLLVIAGGRYRMTRRGIVG